MVILGLDPHPGTHTVAALDRNGSSLANLSAPNTPEGFSQLRQLAAPFPARCWAIEGAGNHFIATFVSQLLEQGEIVYSVPPGLTSQYRARRGRKKNDVVDAENVGRALLANLQLPALHTLDQQRELQELTRAQRRLSEQLKASRSALKELMAQSPVRDILRQVIRVLVNQLRKLKEHIQLSVNRPMPDLLAVPGVGPIIAGVLLAETGDPRRFASTDHFASYCGAAPVERSSGQNRRMQVNPGGNRRLDWAIHIVVMVRLRVDGGHSKAFFEKLRLRGKSKRSALRLLKPILLANCSESCAEADLLIPSHFWLDKHIPGSSRANAMLKGCLPTPIAVTAFPKEIISQCVWLYFHFSLSLRDVELRMAARGVLLTDETVRNWCDKFRSSYATQLKRRRAQFGDKWHLDEALIPSAKSGVSLSILRYVAQANPDRPHSGRNGSGGPSCLSQRECGDPTPG
jgi:transposase